MMKKTIKDGVNGHQQQFPSTLGPDDDTPVETPSALKRRLHRAWLKSKIATPPKPKRKKT